MSKFQIGDLVVDKYLCKNILIVIFAEEKKRAQHNLFFKKSAQHNLLLYSQVEMLFFWYSDDEINHL